MMSGLKLWVRAVRPFAYSASIIPVVLGTILAASDGFFSPLYFLLVLAGGLFLHTGTNLVNDYFDFVNGVDTSDSYGSSGVLVSGLLPPAKILKAGYVAYGLALVIGLYLTSVRGPGLLALGVLGLLGGYFYTANPVSYKYRGLGVPLVFFLMGPLMVAGAYYVQTSQVTPLVLLASVPVGCLVAAILHANEYRDVQHDSSHGITTPSIVLGRRRARIIYYLLVTGAYTFVIFLVVTGLLSTWALLTVVTLPAALRLFRVVEIASHMKEISELKSLDQLTAQLHLQFGFLLVLGLFVERFIGSAIGRAFAGLIH